jgi:hypothetical protein
MTTKTKPTTEKAAPLSEEMKAKLLEITEGPLTGRELMGSKWGNCEAETIAMQCLASCAYNLKKHGDAFSFQGVGTKMRFGNGLSDNPKGMQSLLQDGSIIAEPYEGPVVPENGGKTTVLDEHGKWVCLRVTESLILYAAEIMGTQIFTSAKVLLL